MNAAHEKDLDPSPLWWMLRAHLIFPRIKGLEPSLASSREDCWLYYVVVVVDKREEDCSHNLGAFWGKLLAAYFWERLDEIVRRPNQRRVHNGTKKIESN